MKINIYSNSNKKIGECECYTNEYGDFTSYNSENLHINGEYAQTEKQGIVQSLEITIKNSLINQNILQTILAIEWEFGFQAGKWEENEYIFEQIAESEFNYIITRCNEYNFSYSINDNITNEILKETAEEHKEELLTIEQIDNVEVNIDNYWQFDALANHIKDKLIEHLIAQL